MKIERILYGMQTKDGKIDKIKTAGVNNLLTLQNQEKIRILKPTDSHQYLWFKTEQTIAYPIIIDVADKDPKHGGRTWVQNQTFLVNIHEFFTYVQSGKNPFEAFNQAYLGELEVFPDNFNALTV